MKTYTFFIYRPIVAIIPLIIFFTLTFLMVWFLVPLMRLISNSYLVATVFIILAFLITFLVFYVRKQLLIKTVAILDTHILRISYEGFFLSNKKNIIINCTEIYSITLKKYLGKEYRLTIKYGREKKQIVFIKVDGRFSVKDDFLVFEADLKEIHASLNMFQK